jgi:hypothetical protein
MSTHLFVTLSHTETMRARVRAIASEGGREGGREIRVDFGKVEYRSGWRSARRFVALPSLLLPR